MQMIFLLLSFNLLLFADNYILLNSTENFSLLNKYKQKIEERDLRRFEKFKPFRIIEEDGIIVNRYIRYSKITDGENEYYLLKNEDGSFSLNGNGKFIIEKNVITLLDTVILKKDVEINFINNAIQSKIIPKNSKILRIFKRKANNYYVRSLGISGVFGTIFIDDSYFTKEENSTSKPVNRFEEIYEKVLAKVGKTNKFFEKLYFDLNRLTGKEKDVPKWDVTINQDEIICLLKNFELNSELPESIEYMVKELQFYTIGTDYKVVFSKGKIVIREQS